MKKSELNKLASLAKKVRSPEIGDATYETYLDYAKKSGLHPTQAAIMYKKCQENPKIRNNFEDNFLHVNKYRYKQNRNYSINYEALLYLPPPLMFLGLMFLIFTAMLLPIVSPYILLIPLLLVILSVASMRIGSYLNNHAHDNDEIELIFSEDNTAPKTDNQISPVNTTDYQKNNSLQESFSSDLNLTASQHNSNVPKGTLSQTSITRGLSFFEELPDKQSKTLLNNEDSLPNEDRSSSFT